MTTKIMTKVKSFIHGIYPRSEMLAQVSRDVDRNRKTVLDLERARKKDFNTLVAQQEKHNFSYIEDGKLSWQDIFRPIVESTSGFSVGSLTRWFDNNAFFRQPIITGRLSLNEEKIANFFPKISAKEGWKVTLPSPYLLAKLAVSEKEQNFDEILEQTTEVITNIVKFLSQRGVAFVQLNEPALPYFGANKKELAQYAKVISKIASKKGLTKLAVHFYFGDAASVIAEFIKAEVLIDAIGIDFVKTNLTSLPKRMPYDIIAGVVEGRNSLLEKEQALKLFIKKLIKTQKPNTLYLTNNSDLQFLPETVAVKKVALLGKLQKSFRHI